MITTANAATQLMRTTSRHVSLTPCDYLYLMHHQVLRRTVRSGSMAFMAADVQGHPEPEQVRRLLASLLLEHPIFVAPLRTSLLTGRPYWPLRPLTPEAAAAAAQRAHQYEDLRQTADWRSCLDGRWHSRYTPEWDLATGPQLKLDQYALPDGTTRFSLHWPHFVMDADGALLLLATLAGDAGSMILPDGPPTNPLAGASMFQRLAWFRRGFSLNEDCRGIEAQPLFGDARQPLTSFAEVHRHWEGEQFCTIQARASAATPPGPALLSRYLAACVIRALHALYQEAGVQTDAYLITLPTRVRLAKADGTPAGRRPLAGNYIVSPVICGRRTAVADASALPVDIQRQWAAYHRAEGDLAQWTMVWAASYLRASWYPLLFKMRMGFEALSSGFSYVRASDYPIDAIAGAPVVRMHCGGPLATPPGWNPVFMRYRDGLSLSLTWNRPSVADETARRYDELIAREVVGGD